MNKLIITFTLLILYALLPLNAQEAAAPNWVGKVQKALISVTTYDQQGNALKTGTAFYVSTDGLAVADYALFNGAYSAVVTNSDGQKSQVERIMGADDTYALVRFLVADIKKATAVSIAATPPAIDAMVFALHYSASKIKQCPAARVHESKTINDKHPYFTLSRAFDETYLGAPLFNSNGELVGTIQPSVGLNGYALGASFIGELTIKAITTKVNNLALENIHIAKGLPDTAEESLVYTYIKSQTLGNDEYLDLLNLFIRTYPDNAEGYSRRATLFIDLHRFEDAEADLQSYLRRSEDKAVANSKIAEIIYTKLLYQPTPEYDKWNYDVAIDYVNKAIAEHPESLEYKLLKAQILMSKHDYDAAIDIFREVNSSPDRSAATLYVESLAHDGRGDSIDIQMALVDSAIATFPEPLPSEAATYVLRRGQLNAMSAKYREAVNDYNQYCFLLGQKVSETFYYDRAKLEIQVKMYQQALDDLSKAISMSPGTLVFYIEKCGLLLRVNLLDECITTAQQALRLSPDNIDAYRMMGYAQIQKGEREQGRKNLEEAVKRGDDAAREIIEKYLK